MQQEVKRRGTIVSYEPVNRKPFNRSMADKYLADKTHQFSNKRAEEIKAQFTSEKQRQKELGEKFKERVYNSYAAHGALFNIKIPNRPADIVL